jgi:hypothetical protein
MFTVPVWGVALVVAAIAPWCVRLLTAAMLESVRRRTLDTIAQQEQAAASPLESAKAEPERH